MAKKPAERMASMRELLQQLVMLKANGLPDVTLSLNAIDTDAENCELSQLVTPAIAATSAFAAVACRVTSEVQAVPELMPNFDLQESAEKPASCAHQVVQNRR